MVIEKLYAEKDGTLTMWRYDFNINPNGPIEVINDYKVGDETVNFKVEKSTRKPAKKLTPAKPLGKTKQKYLNPATGKLVGYVRAKNLGLI